MRISFRPCCLTAEAVVSRQGGGGKLTSCASLRPSHAHLLAQPLEAHFLFLSYHQTGTVERLRAQFEERLHASTLGHDAKSAWRRHLHFANGTVSALGGAIRAVLKAWQSPINRVTTPRIAVPRMDGHYGWCAWPDEVQSVVLNHVSDPCTDSHRPSGTPSDAFAFVQLDGYCPAAVAARALVDAGWAGVVLAQAFGEEVIEVGAGGTPDEVAGVVTMVSHAAGLAIAEEMLDHGGTEPRGLNVTLNYSVADGFFLSVDRLGRLQQVGWQKYPQLMMLGWAAQFLTFASRTEQSAGHEAALVVPVMRATSIRSAASARILLPPLDRLRQQANSMMVDFELQCAGVT